MVFTDMAAYWESSAAAWASQYDRKAGTMHPPLRHPENRQSRIRTVRAGEERVLELCEALDAGRVFDLGCGFAGSLLYLANIRSRTVFSGICSSGVEMETARDRIRRAGLVQGVMVFQGDFEDGRNYRVFPAQDLVFALDSWRHAMKPALTLGLLATRIRSGGRLLIMDWFRISDGEGLAPKDMACLDSWTNTAGVPAVPDLRGFLADCRQQGFDIVSDQSEGHAVGLDFLTRWRLRLAAPLVGLFNRNLSRVWTARLSADEARRKGLLDYRVIELIRV